MTAAEWMVVALPFGLAVAGGAVWVVAWWRDPGTPTAPDWQPHELSNLPAGWVPPSGRHRWDAEFAAQQISTNRRYIGRHSEDEIPPSIASQTLELPVVDRARVLSWSLARRAVRPVQVVTPRARLVRLALARRLKEVGVADGLAASLVSYRRRGDLP